MSQNVFKNADGTLIARRIQLNEIPTTISWLEGITGLDLSKEKDKNGVPVKWLGTTGRKSDSGDLDLSVDESEITKEQLKNVLIQWAKGMGIPDAEIQNSKNKRDGWIQLAGDSVHFRAPINGDPKNGFVQTDFMFSADPKWQQWSMRGGLPGSPYKGMHRHIILASIARAQGMKYSYKNALLDPTTDQILTKNPDQIAKLLLGKTATSSDAESTESILDKIKGRPDYEQLIAAAKETLGKEGIILPESVQFGSPGWFRQLMDSINNEELVLSADRPKVITIAQQHGVSREYIQAQLEKGIAVEFEHTDDRSTAIQIALNHLAEDPDYYIKLKKIEKKPNYLS